MYIVLWLLTLLVIVVSLLWIRFHWNTLRKLAKLPHINPQILFRNLDILIGNPFVKDATPFYKRVLNGFNGAMTAKTRNMDVFVFWFGFRPKVLLRTAKSVEQLLTSPKLIEKSSEYDFFKPWLATGLLTSGSDKWRSRRKFLTPSFHFRILNDYISIMSKHSTVLVRKLKEQMNQSLNIVEYVQLEALDVICEAAMGVLIEAQAFPESKYARAVISVSEAIFNRFTHVSQWIDFIYYKTKAGREFKKSVDYLHHFTDEVIKSRKKVIEEALNIDDKHTAEKKTDDSMYLAERKQNVFMDLLIKQHLQGLKADGSSDFTLKDIREEVDTFMFEGFDTVSAALTWALHLLGNNHDIQDKAYEEIHAIFGDDTERQITKEDLRYFKYLDLCIKEALRLYPSVPIIGRKVAEDIDICGYTVPRNATMLVYTYGLHRDPKVFPEPEKYIPERFLPENCLNRHPFAYIPFSAGPRNCIGQKFAMMELKITIAEILRNFKIQSLKENIEISVDIVINAREPVLIKFTPRQ